MSALTGRFALWALAAAALGGVFLTTVSGRIAVETDILAMLPEVDRDPVVERSVRTLSDTAGKTTLFLVGAADLPSAGSAARRFATQLYDSGAFAQLRLTVEYRVSELDALYAAQRPLLLSDRHRGWLQNGEPQRLAQEALQSLYTPAGWLRARPFAEDPLNLYGDFLAQQIPASGRVQLEDGLRVARYRGMVYVLVTADIAGSPFSIAEQQRVMPVIEAAIESVHKMHPGVEILGSGVLRHAHANSERAKREISTFGSVSLVGVVLLLTLTFRSPRPLLLSLLSLGIGGMAALTACHFLFEKVHLVTLVFGSTLIGVAVDYSIHYFADQFRHEQRWNPQDTLHHVGPAILIGMLATVLGYQAFLLPPFPGLRQMAVFSVVGVAAACATVLLAYPLLANRRPARHRPRALLLAQQLALLRLPSPLPKSGFILLLIVGGLAVYGLAMLRFVDDIRTLPASPGWLQDQEARVREIVGSASDTRFFLVEGATAEAALQAEEHLRLGLDRLVAQGKLGSYQALTRAVPSALHQRENHALLAQEVYGAQGPLAAVLREAGYPTPRVRAVLEAFPREAPPPLTVDAWLRSPASAGQAHLWLGETGRGYATAVTLSGVNDQAALQALAESQPQVRFIDRVAAISNLMGRYRRIAMACLAAAYGVIGLVLGLRYGARVGTWLLAAPLGAATLTLATLGLIGAQVNLFNILALLLVLGMGVDYAVFMREGGGSRPTVIMAILLAGLMTLLSFGMLAFSATPFIRSIGLTVLLGVSYTLGLALLCAVPAGGDNPRAAAPAQG